MTWDQDQVDYFIKIFNWTSFEEKVCFGKLLQCDVIMTSSLLLVAHPIISCLRPPCTIPWRPEVFNSPRQILTLLNKVPGYWLQGKTDLANKPRNMQIFPHSKFGINRTAGSKVMAKKFKFWPSNFLAITFEPVVRLIPNFECRKICMFLGLFAKSVSPWSQ